MLNAAYGAYHARCWAEGKTDAEILAEIARTEAKASRTRDWQEVGNATCDYARADTLRAILDERAAHA